MKRLSIRLGIIGVLMASGILGIAQSKLGRGSGDDNSPEVPITEDGAQQLAHGGGDLPSGDAGPPSATTQPQPVLDDASLAPMGVTPVQGYGPDPTAGDFAAGGAPNELRPLDSAGYAASEAAYAPPANVVPTDGQYGATGQYGANGEYGANGQLADTPTVDLELPPSNPSGLGDLPPNAPAPLPNQTDGESYATDPGTPPMDPQGLAAAPPMDPQGLAAAPPMDPQGLAAAPPMDPQGLAAAPPMDPQGLAAPQDIPAIDFAAGQPASGMLSDAPPAGVAAGAALGAAVGVAAGAMASNDSGPPQASSYEPAYQSQAYQSQVNPSQVDPQAASEPNAANAPAPIAATETYGAAAPENYDQAAASGGPLAAEGAAQSGALQIQGGPESSGTASYPSAEPSASLHAGSEREPAGAGDPNGYGAAPNQYQNLMGSATSVAPVAASQADDLRSAPTPGSRQLEGRQTPFVAIEKQAPQEIRVGQPATFKIVVRNAGQVTAQDVTVIDQVPNGTEFIDATPQPQQLPNGTLIWSFGAIEPGQDRVVAVRLMPKEEGEIGSVAKVVCQSQASVRTICTRPELQLKQTAPSEVLIGEELQVLIEVSNPGTGAAENVVLEADVPQALVHRMGRHLDYNIGTLQPKETKSVRLSLSADQAGIAKHAVRARAGNIERQDAIDIEVVAPNLQTKILGPAKRYLRREASFELELANPGTATARDIQAVIYLPQGLEFKSASHQGRYQPQNHAIMWRLEELPKGKSGKVQFAVLPVADGDQTLRSEARGSLNTAANSEHTLAVESLNELIFTVADVNDPIEVGSETTYEIRVTNNGSKTDGNIEVIAQLPEGMQLANADGPTKHQVDGPTVAFAPLPRLAPNGDAVYRIAVKGAVAGDHRLRVQIRSQESPTPVIKEEVTRVYQDR